MKIEKINDNQIRCTLTRDDLNNRQLKLSELAYGTEKAKELFATTDLRTHEVAELTGFGDDSYFSKIFRKVSGKNPGSFRKRNIL